LVWFWFYNTQLRTGLLKLLIKKYLRIYVISTFWLIEKIAWLVTCFWEFGWLANMFISLDQKHNAVTEALSPQSFHHSSSKLRKFLELAFVKICIANGWEITIFFKSYPNSHCTVYIKSHYQYFPQALTPATTFILKFLV